MLNRRSRNPDRRDRRRRLPPHSAAAQAREFMETLRTLFVAHAVKQLTGDTAYHLEQRLHRTHPRGGRSGGAAWNLLRKHLRGTHAAERAALQGMVKLAPSIEYDTYSAMWRLLERRPRGARETKKGLMDVDDVSYYSCHHAFLFPNLGRYPMPIIDPKIDALVAHGTPDAVATLAVLALGPGVDSAFAWKAARAVPAALATWSQREGAQRVVPFVWARLRQLGLDALRLGALRLATETVELPLASTPPGYPLQKVPLTKKKRFYGGNPEPAAIEDPIFQAWLSDQLIAETQMPANSLWESVRTPAQWLRDFGLHGNAERRFRAVLGEYLGEAHEPPRPIPPPARRLRSAISGMPTVIAL